MRRVDRRIVIAAFVAELVAQNIADESGLGGISGKRVPVRLERPHLDLYAVRTGSGPEQQLGGNSFAAPSFQPADAEGTTSGATERLKTASVLTNEAWSPRGTPDQSESVSAVGSGSSSNDEIFRAVPLSHETSSRENPADNNNEERYGFIS